MYEIVESWLKPLVLVLHVDLKQPPTPYSEIGNYAALGDQFSYCFMVFTQGISAVSEASLLDTSERGAFPATCRSKKYPFATAILLLT
eukprot:scaffold172391_cov39-Prasinocladus_malaysianus.AAC.1